jgi:hypothetical protein
VVGRRRDLRGFFGRASGGRGHIFAGVSGFAVDGEAEGEVVLVLEFGLLVLFVNFLKAFVAVGVVLGDLFEAVDFAAPFVVGLTEEFGDF